jgi:hypothetical protein
LEILSKGGNAGIITFRIRNILTHCHYS